MQVQDVRVDRRDQSAQRQEPAHIGRRVDVSGERNFVQPDRWRNMLRDVGRGLRAPRVSEMHFVAELREAARQSGQRREYAATECLGDLQDA